MATQETPISEDQSRVEVPIDNQHGSGAGGSGSSVTRRGAEVEEERRSEISSAGLNDEAQEVNMSQLVKYLLEQQKDLQRQVFEFQAKVLHWTIGGGKGGNKNTWGGLKLDIQHFSRILNFEGDMSRFTGRLFEVIVVVGQIERELSEAIKVMIEKDNLDKAEDVTHRAHEDVPAELCKEYAMSCMEFWYSSRREARNK